VSVASRPSTRESKLPVTQLVFVARGVFPRSTPCVCALRGFLPGRVFPDRTTRRHGLDRLPPKWVGLAGCVVTGRASDSMSSWRIASTLAIRSSFAFSNERLVACWAVRRRRSVSASALKLSASSGWPEAAAFNAGDPEREPPRVLAFRMFVRTPTGGT